MQQNHCDGVLSNDWNTLLGQQISQHTAMSLSRSALAVSTMTEKSSKPSLLLYKVLCPAFASLQIRRNSNHGELFHILGNITYKHLVETKF